VVVCAPSETREEERGTGPVGPVVEGILRAASAQVNGFPQREDCP